MLGKEGRREESRLGIKKNENVTCFRMGVLIENREQVDTSGRVRQVGVGGGNDA